MQIYSFYYRPNAQYGVVQSTGIIQGSRIVAPKAIVSTGEAMHRILIDWKVETIQQI
jgi:hypothetical protein